MTEAIFDRRAIPAQATIAYRPARDGWKLRCFHWEPEPGQTPRGAILFQCGRGDFFEKALESFDHWHRLGWTITAFDWRGQGGSGRLTPAGNCGHIDDFATFIDDLADFAADWRQQTPGPHVVMGHSMGGHLVLRGLVEGQVQADAAVLIAPMLGLHSPLGQGERIARLMGRIGNPMRPAWKTSEKPYALQSRQSLLTHDSQRYQDETWWQHRQPEVVAGPASWGWVSEAFRSIRELRTNPRLQNMTTPLLALVALKDGLVAADAALALLARLPDARIVRFGAEAAHELLRERDPVRDRALAEIDRFLAERAQ